MAYSAGEVDGVVVFIWWRPELEQLPVLPKMLADNATRHGGKKPVCIALSPVGAEEPDGATRAEMSATMKDVAARCSTFHLVLEGHGLKQSARRSVAAGIFLVAGTRNVHVHDSLAQALTKAGVSELLNDVEALVTRLRQERAAAS